MAAKDYFSGHARAYAAFRPVYPEELYAFIFNHLKNRSLAWDCATGNGQVAQYLCKHFKKVYATDISQQQLDNAWHAENIEYSLNKAEDTNFPDNHFDLITIAQALHWIDTASFYKEAVRTSTADALLAVWGYSLPGVDPKIDQLILEFYRDMVGPYWDAARRHVDEHYNSIPFPFEQIPAPEFHIKVSWTLEQFGGYVTSWSATQKYIIEKGIDPVIDFKHQLQRHWPKDETKAASFPLFLKLGRIHS